MGKLQKIMGQQDMMCQLSPADPGRLPDEEDINTERCTVMWAKSWSEAWDAVETLPTAVYWISFSSSIMKQNLLKDKTTDLYWR